jgi:hypothetical protein
VFAPASTTASHSCSSCVHAHCVAVHEGKTKRQKNNQKKNETATSLLQYSQPAPKLVAAFSRQSDPAVKNSSEQKTKKTAWLRQVEKR